MVPWLLAGIAILLVLTGSGAIWAWNSGLSLDQRLVAIGDVLAAGGLALAFFAGLVATLAYRVSTQRPALIPSIKVDGMYPIEVGLAGPDSAGERRIVKLPAPGLPNASVPLVLRVENVSDWSARNVAVRVELKGMRGLDVAVDWVRAAADLSTGHITAVQWEGGADYAIHGNWFRELPSLELAGVIVDPPREDCHVVVDVVAEGFQGTWRFPVSLVSRGEEFDRETGSIDGWANYPSSGVPSLRIYAIPSASTGRSQRILTPAGPPGKYRWFRFSKVLPGEYHVVAYVHGLAGIAGAFSTESRPISASTRSLGVVEVEAGHYVDDVKVTSWGKADEFPSEP